MKWIKNIAILGALMFAFSMVARYEHHGSAPPTSVMHSNNSTAPASCIFSPAMVASESLNSAISSSCHSSQVIGYNRRVLPARSRLRSFNYAMLNLRPGAPERNEHWAQDQRDLVANTYLT